MATGNANNLGSDFQILNNFGQQCFSLHGQAAQSNVALANLATGIGNLQAAVNNAATQINADVSAVPSTNVPQTGFGGAISGALQSTQADLSTMLAAVNAAIAALAPALLP